MAIEYLRALGVDVVDRLRARGLTVGVKTNYGPELTLYRAEKGDVDDGAGVGRGLLEQLLDLKAAFIVRDGEGRPLAVLGDDPPPATEPVRVAVLVMLVGVLAFIFARGVLK